MKGAIIGDIVGSAYERKSIKSKEFKLFKNRCRFTDDSVLTAAVAQALIALKQNGGIESDEKSIRTIGDALRQYGQKYLDIGYGTNFKAWLQSDNPQPYQGFTNGALMRCSAAGWIADSADQARRLGRLSAMPTHDHPEAITAASLAAEVIFRARKGASKEELLEIVQKEYVIEKISEIRPTYGFDMTCRGTFPVAFAAFYESTDFEDAIRTAVWLGGDTDTNGAIAGSFAEAFYGVPDALWETAKTYCDETILAAHEAFCAYLTKGESAC